MRKPTFKAYPQTQLLLLPPSLDELIDSNHPVRLINNIVDKLDLQKLIATYEGGGCSSYSPRMLLKILLYGYMSNVFSSRKLETMNKENIHFMWLSAMTKPDHNTINRFRSERLKDTLKGIFTQVVELMIESGHVSLNEVYTDGTKIEANANRYSFVWGNSIKHHKNKIKKQLEELWDYAQKLADEEKKDTGTVDFEPTDPAKVSQTIEKINEILNSHPEEVDKKIKEKVNYGKKHWPEAVAKYNEQEKIMGERNSYSKIDPDATFMRMKEDHMKNGQLKPAYNVQFSTQNQYVVHYSIHQNPTDTKTLIPHVEEIKTNYNLIPEKLIADAGYGSEQNYEYLASEGIEAYVKYNMFDSEQKPKRVDKKPFASEKLYYNEDKNLYICPMGQEMKSIGQYDIKSEAGYVRRIEKYQAKNCSQCPLNGICHKSKTNRIIEVSHRGNYLKNQAKSRLQTELGIELRKKRSIEPEPVFGNIKQNKGFKRFMLRGIDKVSIEIGLLAITNNIAKQNKES
jgi:transposase